MGLFGSKKKTYVGTQVQRVIEDGDIPNAVRTGITKSIFDEGSGGNQMVEYVLEELSNNIGIRASRMYNYGKDKYIFGLPQSSYHSSLAGNGATQAAIAAQVGGSVDLSYYHFGPVNNLHIGWQKLTEDHAYDAGTNQIKSMGTPEKPYFLVDMQVVVTEATATELDNGSMDQWGTPPNAGPNPINALPDFAVGSLGKATSFAVDPSAPSDYVRVDYCWEEPTQVVVDGITINRKIIHRDSFNISLAGIDTESDYHQARYVKGDGSVGYWTYKAGTGTHPEIDNVFDTVLNDSGSFFPFGYLRYDKKSEVDDPNSEVFKSSKKLFSYLNMDYEAIGKTVNENPDIKDVESAILMMAVPADTSNPIEQQYLFDFFSGLQSNTASYNNNVSSLTVFGIKMDLGQILPASSIIIQDKRFKMALSWDTIVKRKVAGSIGPKGSYGSGSNSKEVVQNVPMIGGGTFTFATDTPVHYYRKQVTESVYEEIIIAGLEMKYWVFENYTTTGDEANEKILLIPLDVNIVEQYTIPEREKLYSRALHFVFNSRQVVKLKWYQTGVFKAIITIVAIVITVLSYGSTWQTIGAAVAAGTVTVAQVVTMFIIGLLKYLLITYTLKLFVKVVGVKFAFVVAIVAALAGSYQMIQAGSISGAPWAKDLMQLSTGLSKGIQSEIQSEYGDLLKEQSEFEKYVEQQTKLLENAQELLGGNNRLDPFIVFGESPDDFYQRTVHSGNIGIVGIDAIENYVDGQLQLPKLPQTIGEA